MITTHLLDFVHRPSFKPQRFGNRPYFLHEVKIFYARGPLNRGILHPGTRRRNYSQFSKTVERTSDKTSSNKKIQISKKPSLCCNYFQDLKHVITGGTLSHSLLQIQITSWIFEKRPDLYHVWHETTPRGSLSLILAPYSFRCNCSVS